MERIRSAEPGEVGAIACSDIDQLHRNDVEFFPFMAEKADRRILVFDATELPALGALFESIEAEALPQRGLRLVAVPRGVWRGFIQLLVLELHTGACSNLEELAGTLKSRLNRRGSAHP